MQTLRARKTNVKREGMRKWIGAKTAGLLGVGLLVLAQGSLGPAAFADDRDDAAAAQKAADEQITQLQTEVEGLDADLAQVYIELGEVRANLPVAEEDLVVAQNHLAVTEREYQQIKDQLTAAHAERDRLDEELEAAAAQEEELNSAIGSMAREMYRGDVSSPLTLVMTSEGTGDITDRAASATTMSRAQSRAMDSVRESMTVTKNQAERQEAVTERIAELEEAANEKLEEAVASRDTLETKVSDLKALKGQLEVKQNDWDKRKAEAETQLAEWEAKRSDALDRIAKIDAENRAKQVTFEAPPEAAAEAPAAAPAPGALFASPLPGAVVTSNYGWRIHPILGYSKLHDGTDFGAACGTAQRAIAPGSVVASYFDSGGGNMVIINHGMLNGSSWTSEHLHLESPAVSVGQSVSAGTVVGYTGTTGSSTGCHLHLTVTRDGATVDPLDYM